MARNFTIVQDFGLRVRLKNGSSALSEGDMVYIDSNGLLAEVADNNTTGAVGVCCEDIAAGEYGWVYIDGIFKGQAASGVDFSIGDPVYTASASTLDAGSTNDVPVGVVVHTDPSSGGTVYFRLWSQLVGNSAFAAHS